MKKTNLMRNIYFTITLIFCILICIPESKAQDSIFTLEHQTSKKSQLSEKHLDNLIQKLDNGEITLSQVKNIARQKGASEDQILELEKRIEDRRLNKNKTIQTEISKHKKNNSKIELSEKKEIIISDKQKEVFGVQFFNTKNLDFSPNVNTQVSDDYILATGDNVQINVYGASQQNYSVEVENSRAINISGVGPIYVGGLSFANAKRIIKQSLSSIYSGMQGKYPNTFASISIGNISGIKVNVIGEATLPGTYTLPATASVFTALYLAGGPNTNGSFRAIDIMRNGQKAATVDVYKYLVDGNTKTNIQLRNNDVILIRPYVKRIFVSGAFKRKGIFEAKEGETVADIIKYAGGFSPLAYKKTINLIRNSEDKITLRTIDTNNFSNTLVENGDKIESKETLNRFKNRVKISGAVAREGEYQLSPTMDLKALIEKAGGLNEEAFMSRGIINRKDDKMEQQTIAFSTENIMNGTQKIFLKREDNVFISSISDLKEKQTVEISGAVQNSGTYNYAKNMTLTDLIFISGGFKKEASVSNIEIVSRLKESNKNGELVETQTVAVDKDLKLGSADKRFILKPYDKIFVRSSAIFSHNQGSVNIIGEINFGGQYGIKNKKERISDLIARAGGLTTEAYPTGASLRRKVILTETEIDARKKMYERDSLMSVEEINKIEYTTVAINLEKIMEDKGGESDLLLKDGDKILIPRRFQTVKVSGAVLNPLSITFKKNLSVKDYINMSGGFAMKAKKRKVYVIYPNGEAHATTGMIFRDYPKVVPGCEIIVPQKPQIDRTASAQRWIGIGSGLASIAASVAALISISK